MTVTVAREPVHQPAVRALLEPAWALSGALYPAESNHHLDESALELPDVSFFVARNNTTACGCGALMRVDERYGEVKSLFVAPAARGLGLARALLAAIEAEARKQGLSLLRLETGIRQPEAIGLYEATGFRRIAPFGTYQDDPLSLFMEKAL
ncbi:GNAT family N-acetyltransferase [Acidisoma cellulosilytica]|uniref:GNAT family N-acetyltransferase n=1 Tax=Acidisoma cellulosilyticum TaxID=2802395 RepID=A0A963YY60_9PROT|nr:GNAT family N-acetyltransferase [Acidisoma cellulosilyticum]MCB8878949.1 GNAT family N-acetyltransferase [Acidisoma cellulosilyticum]